MNQQTLEPFPKGTTREKILVELGLEKQTMNLCFSIPGTGAPRLTCFNESPQNPKRVDELWKDNCFECFIFFSNASIYWEYNIAPSGDWQAYRFSGYRRERKELDCSKPALSATKGARAVSVKIDILLPECNPSSLKVAPACILRDEQKSFIYWALEHQGGPDFHRCPHKAFAFS